MEIEELKKLLICSWNIETCSPILRCKWDDENPSLGQCAITALIVNDLFGGNIMRCMSSTGSHYYNLIEDKIFDLTVEQFLGEIPDYVNGEIRTREYLLNNEDTKNRYLLLNKNLQRTLSEKNELKQRKENRFMSEEVSKEFRELLKLRCKQFYVDEKGRILLKKKNN